MSNRDGVVLRDKRYKRFIRDIIVIKPTKKQLDVTHTQKILNFMRDYKLTFKDFSYLQFISYLYVNGYHSTYSCVYDHFSSCRSGNGFKGCQMVIRKLRDLGYLSVDDSEFVHRVEPSLLGLEIIKPFL